MTVQDVIGHLEALSPSAYAEDFDNVGLLTGDRNKEVKGILVTLDTLETVVEEAVSKGCNLIVSFHPIIFKGLKSLTGDTYVERCIIKAIKNDIAIYAIHTALDNAFDGVNAMICETLGLSNRKILLPQKGTIKKLTTYVPEENAVELREALFKAGAGEIGNYSHCSFNALGTGTYKGNQLSNPTIGKAGEFQEEAEVKITMTYQKHVENKVFKALFKNHPYEEVAYELLTLDNSNQTIGMGMIGELENEMSETAFLKMVRDKMRTGIIRHSELLGKPVKTVAVLGGSGSFAIAAAKRSGADFFMTADLKYHDFFAAEGQLVLADIGHYESEQYTKSLLVQYLTKKIPNFAIILSQTNTNPVKYF